MSRVMHHQARAPVRRGPGRQTRRRVEHVLDAVHRDRLLLAHHVQDALHAQQVLAAVARQRAHPQAERIPVDRLVERQAGGADAAVVAVDVRRPARVFVIIMMIMAVMIMVMIVVMLLVGLRAQPVLHVDRLRRRIVETRAEQARRRDVAVAHVIHRRAGVERVEARVERGDRLRRRDVGSWSATSRSATAACFTDSNWRVELVLLPFTASTVVTTLSSR